MVSVELIKEDNRLSDQTFTVDITIETANISGLDEAILGLDYNLTVTRYPFPPEAQSVFVDFTVLEDSESEGPEVFKLTASISGGALSGEYPCVDITIEDINGMLHSLCLGIAWL